MLTEANPVGWELQAHDSARREECAMSIYRYAMRVQQAVPLRWCDVPAPTRERYRQSADLALAVADDTLGPVPFYIALQTWLEHANTGLDMPALNADPGRRWALADIFRSAMSHARQAAAGLLPERWTAAKALVAKDREAMATAQRRPPLVNRSMTARGPRVLLDLDGNEIERR